MTTFPFSVVWLQFAWALVWTLRPGGTFLIIGLLYWSINSRNSVTFNKLSVMFVAPITFFWQFWRIHSFPKGLHCASISQRSCFSEFMPNSQDSEGRKAHRLKPVGQLGGCLQFWNVSVSKAVLSEGLSVMVVLLSRPVVFLCVSFERETLNMAYWVVLLPWFSST